MVAFANTKYGKDFLSNFGGKELKGNYPIVKVSPDGIHQHIEKNIYRAVFYSRSPYIKLLAEVLTMVDIAKENGYEARKDLMIPHYLGATKLISLPQIFLDSGTFNPDADTETTSVDGKSSNTNATWSTCRDAATGSVATDSDSSSYLAFASTGYEINRGFFLFDTSSLNDNATKDSATFSLYRNDVQTFQNVNTTDIDLVTSTPASNTAITTADYDQIGSSVLGSFAMASTSNGSYFDITVSDLSTVSLTGISKYAVRNSRDTDNSAPTSSNQISGNYADNGTNIPKLVVNYTLPSSVSGNFHFM